MSFSIILQSPVTSRSTPALVEEGEGKVVLVRVASSQGYA